MPTIDWRHTIETLQQQVDAARAALAHPPQWPGVLRQTVEVLQTALKGLRVAAEEQQQQHEAARQQVEVALRDSEARQHAILQTAVDGIITIDERGTVESLNPAAERLFGYTADEVIGQNISLLMPAPYREAHDGYLTRYLQTGEPHIIGIGRDVRGQRRDGTTFPMALAVSEVRLDDRRLFTGIVHDLSARVQAEEALRQAHDALEQRVQERTAALQEANEDIRRFAYIVSHDLRAPLINLHGFAQELRDACAVLTAALPAVVPHLGGRREPRSPVPWRTISPKPWASSRPR